MKTNSKICSIIEDGDNLITLYKSSERRFYKISSFLNGDKTAKVIEISKSEALCFFKQAWSVDPQHSCCNKNLSITDIFNFDIQANPSQRIPFTPYHPHFRLNQR